MSAAPINFNSLPVRTDILSTDDIITKRGTASGAEGRTAFSILKAAVLADAPGGGGGAVTSVAGRTGAVVLAKADVGLTSVDNTADAAKPVSTAQATAIAAAQAAAIAAAIAAMPAGSSIRKSITQTAHGFSAKQAIYNNNGTWALARADAINTARVVAVIESVTSANAFVAVFAGEITVSGWSPNTQYFLSDATAGLLTSVQPTAPTSYVVAVALAGTATLAYVGVGGAPLSLALIPLSAISGFSTDGTLASNSDAKIPSEKAVKAYIDAAIAAL